MHIEMATHGSFGVCLGAGQSHTGQVPSSLNEAATNYVPFPTRLCNVRLGMARRHVMPVLASCKSRHSRQDDMDSTFQTFCLSTHFMAVDKVC